MKEPKPDDVVIRVSPGPHSAAKEPQNLIYAKGKTLLESLEQDGVEVHYHCREGFCGACRTRLTKGSVTYNSEPLAYIDDGEILPCCCIPNSDIDIELA